MEVPPVDSSKTFSPEEKKKEIALTKQKIALVFTPLYTFFKVIEEDRMLKDKTWDAFYPVISEQGIEEIFEEVKTLVKKQPELKEVYEKFFSEEKGKIVRDEKLNKLIDCLKRGNKNEVRGYFAVYGNTLGGWFDSLMNEIYAVIQM